MKILSILTTGCASALLGTSLFGATVNVAYDTGVVNTTTALTGFQTTGAQMSGMTVTAFFAGGSSETAIWAATGAVSGAAAGTGWSLTESGDTFSNNWTLGNNRTNPLVRLLIDAGPGDTVFDTAAVVSDTTGSALGLSFSLVSISPVDNGNTINATYRDAVALGANAPVGDLFRRLDVTFSSGLSNGSTLVYKSDTDNINFAGDIRPVNRVPDAMSTLLGLSAALGLLGAAKRFI